MSNSELSPVAHLFTQRSRRSCNAMDLLCRTSLFHLTLLVLIMGSCMLDSTHGVDLHRLNKRCHFQRDMKFPSMITVTLNVTGHSQPHGTNLGKRSLSPWDYSYDVDYNRYPPVIAVAKCLHENCVTSEGDLDTSGNSVPIRQEILVLHRETKDCKPVFRMEKKMVTVGCTCVRPITQHLA